MVLISVVGYAALGPLVGLAASVPALFAALAAWGAFQGMLDVSMNTQAVAVERRAERPLMNGFHAWWSVGAFGGAAVGAAAVGAGVGLTPQLLGLGAVALLATVATAPAMLPDAAARTEPAARPARRRLRLSPAAALLGVIALASMLCEGAAADWSSVYLRDSLGTGAGVAGLGYAAFALAMVVVRVVGDRLTARFAARRLVPALAAAASLGFLAALLLGRPVPGDRRVGLAGAGAGHRGPDRLQRGRAAERAARRNGPGHGDRAGLGRVRRRSAADRASGGADLVAGRARHRARC